MREVRIAENKFLEQRPVTTTFEELANACLTCATYQQQKRSWKRDRTSVTILKAYFGGKRLPELTPSRI